MISERATGEVEDKILGFSTIVDKWKGIEQKQEIWSILSDCFDTQNERWSKWTSLQRSYKNSRRIPRRGRKGSIGVIDRAE